MIFPTAETNCGPGSMMDATVNVRAWLPGALERLGVKVLLDAPCGDRNWIRHVKLPCAYIGVDNEEAHMARARDGGADVRLLDIRSDPLPEADAILSRDFLQHLSKADLERALDNFEASGATYLIATCHGVEDDKDIHTGEFRRVSLRGRFGVPIDSVADGPNGRILGAWEL